MLQMGTARGSAEGPFLQRGTCQGHCHTCIGTEGDFLCGGALSRGASPPPHSVSSVSHCAVRPRAAHPLACAVAYPPRPPLPQPLSARNFRKGFNRIYSWNLAAALRRIYTKHAALFEASAAAGHKGEPPP